MTVGSSELDRIDDKNNQQTCYNNNNTRENKNKSQNSFSSAPEENHLSSSANKPTQLQKSRMGRRKQNCPQKTGIGSVDGKS